MEDLEYRPKKRKKRSKFVRRMRAFVRHVAELPAQTLLVIAGTITIILITIILLVVLLPKRGSQEANTPVVSNEPVAATPTLPAFTPAPTPVPTPTQHPLIGVGTQGSNGWYLQLNDTAPVVADIQTRLIELGYMEMPVIDGVEQVTTTYGPATRTAVRYFQAVNEIELDGCVGEATYDLLMSETAQPMTLRRGLDTALFEDEVKKLQEKLIELGYMDAGSANGKYYDPTVMGVQKFQSGNGLKPDGIAGQATLQLLFSENAKAAGSSAAAPAETSAEPTGTADAETSPNP